MLNVPEAIKTLLKNESVPKNFRIHFPNGEFSDITNENLVAESVKFSESICSQGSFRFGLAEASVIEFETIGIGNMIGCTIEVSCEITYNNEPYSIPYGTFVVNKCPRNHENMTLRKVVAYTENLENNFDIVGQYKNASLVEYFDVIRELDFLKPSQMSEGTLYSRSGNIWLYNSNLSKVAIFDAVLYTRFAIRIDINSPIVINAQYEKCSYDDMAKEFIKAVSSCNLPSGFMYDELGSAAYRVFSDSKQGLVLGSYLCPHYIVEFRNETRTAYSYPIPIEPNVNIPINIENVKPVYGSVDLNTTSATVIICIPYRYENKNYIPSGSTTPIQVGASVETIATYQTQYYPVNQSYWPVSLSADEHYFYRSNYDGIKVHYKQYAVDSSALKLNIKSTGSVVPDATYFKTCYTYYNALPYRDALNGMLEINAQFMKPDREGNFEAINLLNTPQEYLVPNDYISLWWDEYNIEPIGTVRYSYKASSGAIQTADYNFGTGRSLYDMSDNYALQNLIGASEEVINVLLDTYFIPHLSNIVFTPIDFYMRGLPYLEAGDLIDIESEDGVHVQSYIMTMDIDGIHNLTADITSVDGDTMYSEVTT